MRGSRPQRLFALFVCRHPAAEGLIREVDHNTVLDLVDTFKQDYSCVPTSKGKVRRVGSELCDISNAMLHVFCVHVLFGCVCLQLVVFRGLDLSETQALLSSLAKQVPTQDACNLCIKDPVPTVIHGSAQKKGELVGGNHSWEAQLRTFLQWYILMKNEKPDDDPRDIDPVTYDLLGYVTCIVYCDLSPQQFLLVSIPSHTCCNVASLALRLAPVH